MLSEEEANRVMDDIASMEEFTKEFDGPMLNHLYDLHKLRDIRLMYDLCNTRSAFKLVDVILEMNGANYA